MHFTYEDPPDRGTLHQGDVLHRTAVLDEVLREVHPHYQGKQDYRFFVVLTQSCDLVRRKGAHCSARYITIAAVRPLVLAVRRRITSLQYDEVERRVGFCDSRRKGHLDQSIGRLMNNNEDDYFYLHREESAGLQEDHCAFLHLSIALKAHVHYDTLLHAKRLQLREAFQHKLGSIVGQIYSRIGTEDWVPNHADEAAFRNEIRSRAEAVDDVLWIDQAVHKQVLPQLRALPEADQTVAKLEELIGAVHRGKQQKMSELVAFLEEAAADLAINPDAARRLVGRLKNQKEILALLK